PAAYQNMLSSWTFCAAIVLPFRLAALVIVVTALAEWPARNVIAQSRPYRYVYSTAATLLGAAAANRCTALPVLLAVPVGAVAYLTLSLAAVLLAMLAVGQRAEAATFVKPTTHLVEFATVSIAIAAIALLHS